MQLLFGAGDAGRRSFVLKDLGGDQIIGRIQDAEVVASLDGDEVEFPFLDLFRLEQGNRIDQAMEKS